MQRPQETNAEFHDKVRVGDASIFTRSGSNDRPLLDIVKMEAPPQYSNGAMKHSACSMLHVSSC
jgi:hypothetical protein